MEINSPQVGAQATAVRREDRRSLLRRRSFLAGVTALIIMPKLPAFASTPVRYGHGYTGGY